MLTITTGKPGQSMILEEPTYRLVFKTPEQLMEALSPIFALQGAYNGLLRLVLTSSLVQSENLSTCSAEPHQFDILDLSLREFMVAIAESKTRFNQLVDIHRNTYPQNLLISKV